MSNSKIVASATHGTDFFFLFVVVETRVQRTYSNTFRHSKARSRARATFTDRESKHVEEYMNGLTVYQRFSTCIFIYVSCEQPWQGVPLSCVGFSFESVQIHRDGVRSFPP